MSQFGGQGYCEPHGSSLCECDIYEPVKVVCGWCKKEIEIGEESEIDGESACGGCYGAEQASGVDW